jgi:hypothetical protein
VACKALLTPKYLITLNLDLGSSPWVDIASFLIQILTSLTISMSCLVPSFLLEVVICVMFIVITCLIAIVAYVGIVGCAGSSHLWIFWGQSINNRQLTRRDSLTVN